MDRREGAYIARAVRLPVRTPREGYSKSAYRRVQQMVAGTTRKTGGDYARGWDAAYRVSTVWIIEDTFDTW